MLRLTKKQKVFVDEYLVDLNSTQAAIRAGYSAKTANAAGPRLLVNVSVQAAIQAAMRKREQRTEITQDNVLRELAKLGFANMADYMEVGETGEPRLNFANLDRDKKAALTEVTVDTIGGPEGAITKVKFKLADKRAALVDIGKHLGMFRDKVELSGPDGKGLYDGIQIALVGK